MRVIVIMKANKDSEAGIMPSEQQLRDMGNYNEELVKAGIMLSGEGLHPSAKGARVSFSSGRQTVTDGPFPETKGLIAGFWMWQVQSMQEAIEWVQRCPIEADDQAEIEIRPVFEAEDFGAEFTPELRAQEDRLRAQIAEGQAAGVNPVPPPSGAIPYLVIKGASDAIAYYQRAFGAALQARMDMPDGKVMHAEMKVGAARFMLTEESPERQSMGPLSLGGSATTVFVHVPDVDAVVAKALAEGAKPGMPVQDQFWGDRCGGVTDPFGHQWLLATHIEDPSMEEVQRRVQAMFSQGMPGC